jgi:hypothetical protein
MTSIRSCMPVLRRGGSLCQTKSPNNRNRDATPGAIRPTAIGKNNWLFIGDLKTDDHAAAFYTLIGNCHRAGIDAQAYLTDLFTRLPLQPSPPKPSGASRLKTGPPRGKSLLNPRRLDPTEFPSSQDQRGGV